MLIAGVDASMRCATDAKTCNGWVLRGKKGSSCCATSKGCASTAHCAGRDDTKIVVQIVRLVLLRTHRGLITISDLRAKSEHHLSVSCAVGYLRFVP